MKALTWSVSLGFIILWKDIISIYWIIYQYITIYTESIKIINDVLNIEISQIIKINSKNSINPIIKTHG